MLLNESKCKEWFHRHGDRRSPQRLQEESHPLSLPQTVLSLTHVTQDVSVPSLVPAATGCLLVRLSWPSVSPALQGLTLQSRKTQT